MNDPKLRLTRFSQIYSAQSRRRAVAPAPSYRDTPLAGELATAQAVHETDTESLRRLQNQFSISTVEELVALARVDQRFGSELVDRLGVDPRLIQDLTRAFEASASAQDEMADWSHYEELDYELGCELDFTAPPAAEDDALSAGALGTSLAGPQAPALPTLAPSVHLIDGHMPPIKDQGDRGSCVAFTGVACLEYHASRFGGQSGLDLSEQFAFWNLLTKSGQRNLVAMYPLLKSDGVCREATWPYYPKEIPGNAAQGPAPPQAQAEATASRAANVLQLSPRSVPVLKQALQQGRLVGIGIPVYTSWFESTVVRKYGNITVPLPGEVAEPVGHAVVLAGYEDHSEFAGGGYFVVRNSWDHYWASASSLGSGYGTLPYRYITHFNWDAWCLTM